MANTTKFEKDGTGYDFEALKGTIGPDVVDIRTFYGATGAFTFDPGFTSTASCESQITYIDGDEGILLHRGYSIEDLAGKSDYMDVCYALIYGDLPNQSQRDGFIAQIKAENNVPEFLKTVCRGLPKDSHPMAVMTTLTGALSAQYHDDVDVFDGDNRIKQIIRMVAKAPILTAMAYKHSMGEDFVDPSNDICYAENFLNMCFGKANAPYQAKPSVIKAMDRIFILHADHEQNASTATVRSAGSSNANPFACWAAGSACLWGPAHGGANEAVLVMLDEIGNKDNVSTFVDRAKDKSDPFRLMGFGHRVYKNLDPRAGVLKLSCDEVLADLGIEDPLLEVAQQLEQAALEDDYFIQRKLFPNVDFYSGIILKAMKFPTSLFTVLFALSRTVGWMSQWHEMMGQAGMKISRPRQLYTGSPARPFKEISER